MARIIVTGATGFIGRHVVATLLDRRHTVVGVHRGPAPPSLAAHTRFESVSANFEKMTAVEKWTSILNGADAVINCEAGAPSGHALFEACTSADIKRVIQVSDRGLEDGPEDALTKSELSWVVVRPSLVYGPGSFDNGSNLLGLAACPGAIPLPGGGTQTFQPICINDLVGIICELSEATSFNRIIIEPVGPEKLSLKEILLKLRAWLDVPNTRTISIPLRLLTLVTKVTLPLPDTAKYTDSFRGLYAPSPVKIDDVLVAYPSTVQDQSHARQVFLTPVITAVLALYWIVFGGIFLMRGAPLSQDVTEVLDWISFDPIILTFGFSGWAIALGLLVLMPISTRVLAALQGLTLVGYMTLLSLTTPLLWFEQLGPLLNTIPILMLVYVWAFLRAR